MRRKRRVRMVLRVPRWVVEEFKALINNYIPSSEGDFMRVEKTLLEFCRRYPELRGLLEPNDEIHCMLELENVRVNVEGVKPRGRKPRGREAPRRADKAP